MYSILFGDKECNCQVSTEDCCLRLTRRTQDEMERIVRNNYDLLDEQEPGQYMGAFPFGYNPPINTIR